MHIYKKKYIKNTFKKYEAKLQKTNIKTRKKIQKI